MSASTLPRSPRPRLIVDLVIPAFNEEGALGGVIDAVPRGLVRDIIVCDNASTDATAAVADAHGATVVSAPTPGYGSACLAGLAYLAAWHPDERPDVVAFCDGDGSDYPAQLADVVAPIASGEADLVIGSRALGQREPGAMLPHQRFGNWLATTLIRWRWGTVFTDLGPMRAVRYDALERIDMQDPDFGWTVEMQVKAAKLGLRTREVPVDYRARAAGHSKVSGSLSNSVLAGEKILRTIFTHS